MPFLVLLLLILLVVSTYSANWCPNSPVAKGVLMPQTGVFTLDAKQICIVEESQKVDWTNHQKLISSLSNGQTLTLTGPTSGILPIVQRGCGSFDRTKHPTLRDTDNDPQYGCGFFEAKGLNTALTLKNLWLTNSTSGVIYYYTLLVYNVHIK